MHGLRTKLWYGLTCGVLLWLSRDFAQAGRGDLAAGIFVLPMAYEWGLGRFGRAAGIGLLATVAGVINMPSYLGAVEFTLLSWTGGLMGECLRRKWSLGWCVTLVTSLVYGLALASMLWHWEQTREQASLVIASWRSMIENAARQTGGGDGGIDLEKLKWMDDNWANLGLGFVFGTVLFMVTGASAFLASMLRRLRPERGRCARFRDMRPPEWLVWVAIALALLWFIDQRWPHPAVRAVVWNAAIGLSVVYWLNGLSIVIYVAAVFSWPLPLMVAVVLLITPLLQLLSPLGFFDTWWDFRRQADRLSAMRRAAPPDPMDV